MGLSVAIVDRRLSHTYVWHWTSHFARGAQVFKVRIQSMQMNEITLETERLRLRWLREDDFEEYAKICRDPEVMRFLGGQPLTDFEVYRQMAYFMGQWYFRGYGIWAVEEKRTGKLVGRIGF